MNTYHHKLTENRELQIITISDNYVAHSYEFLTHPNWSIEYIKQIIETALLEAARKEDLLT